MYLVLSHNFSSWDQQPDLEGIESKLNFDSVEEVSSVCCILELHSLVLEILANLFVF